MINSESIFHCIIIDDNPSTFTIIDNYIRLLNGFTIDRTFTSPLEGLSFLKENVIDLLFLDIDMPEINGMDLLNLIEKTSQYGTPAVILTTAHTEVALPALRSSKFTRGILCKPFSYDDFLVTLEKIRSITQFDRVLHINQELSENSENFLFVKTKANSLK
ncbi:MAG: response regulator, partial [Tunicatimonas sp.]|uniref:LytR/AlgR family response regulator transcription factor n=1 Tax=Tunicatimonas sp. TaxID=1940096 RepID=UPI003C787B3A